MDLSFGDILLSEILGTAALTLLGCGVVANAILTKNKGFGGGFLMINFGWGFAVMVGILLAAKSGAHLNPAVTIGFLAAGNPIDLSFSDTIAYLCGEFIGAFIGAVLCWAAYKDHFDEEPEAGAKLAVFSTGPAIRNTVSNLITEIIGTFVLLFGILALSQQYPAAQAGPVSASAVRSSSSSSVPRSVARPDTPSTRPVTSAHASPTSCFRSRARATATGLLVDPGRRPDHRRRPRWRRCQLGRIRLISEGASAHGAIRRSDRPRHDQHPVHDLRPLRLCRRGRPDGARADLPARRLGRARRHRDLEQHRDVLGEALGKANLDADQHRRGRHHQPA